MNGYGISNLKTKKETKDFSYLALLDPTNPYLQKLPDVPAVYHYKKGAQLLGASPRRSSNMAEGRLSSAKVSTRSSKMKLEKCDESIAKNNSLFKE